MKRIDEDVSTNIAASAERPLIVHVVRQFFPNRGGLEDVVLNLCRQGVRNGFRIRVVTLNSLFSDPALPLADRETIDGIEVVRIAWKGTSRYPVAPSVLKHIKDADLIHVHAIDFFYDFLAATKIFHGRPMVATTHGGFFHTKRFAAIKSLWFNTVTRFSTSRYSRLIGCSISDVETFSKIAGSNLTLIENGADIGKFAGKASIAPQKRVVTIGRFSFNKRLDRLIETMRILRQSDPQWQLDIVGVSSDLTDSDVKALATGMEDGVHVHHKLDNEEIGTLLCSCSIFASASEYEGFGLVAIEAMSAGLLPVLENNSAYANLAARHPLLQIADFSSPEGSADAMNAAWSMLSADHAAIRQTLIAEAANYSGERSAERYIALYRDILP